MEYFKYNLPIKSAVEIGDVRIWVLEKSYIPLNERLKKPFSQQDYSKNRGEYLYFQHIDHFFSCANPKCKSKNVKCVWYRYDAIAPRVDNTFAEFYCDECKKFTFVENCRDDS